MRQQEDPEFAEVLSRVRTGVHTAEDTAILKTMERNCCKLNCETQCQCECLCIREWPHEPITLYLTNRLTDLHNQRVIDSMNSQIYRITAKDSCKDEATKRCSLENIDKSHNLNETGNLPTHLRLCVGAQVMITYYVDINDRIVRISWNRFRNTR